MSTEEATEEWTPDPDTPAILSGSDYARRHPEDFGVGDVLGDGLEEAP